MNVQNRGLGLLLMGASTRLAVVAVIVLFLWVGFYWATGRLPFFGGV